MAPIDYSIKDIENIVKFDGKVKKVDISRLTAPGENYVSLVLRADFEVEKNGHSKTISTVVKRLPLHVKDNQEKKHPFDMHGEAMKNEIKWYSEIVPIIKDFAKEIGIKVNFLPDYYGSRYSLDTSKSDTVNSDAVLILENLIPQGYQNDDRYIGCDFPAAKEVLKSLALFHALPIAMKLRKPEKFQIIKDFLHKSRPGPPGPPPGEDGHKPFGPPPGAKRPEEMLLDALIQIPDFAPYITKIKPLMEKPHMGPDSFFKLTEEPWNTISHNDFWVNNVMLRYIEGKDPLAKIVDYQMCAYGSYAKDLVFFLLSSVKNDVIKEQMNDLLRIYYDEFTSVLKKADLNVELTYRDYLEEIRKTAESEVSHVIGFSTIIFGEKGTGVDVALVEFDPMREMTNMIKKMNQHQKDKLVVVASEAIKRNWI